MAKPRRPARKGSATIKAAADRAEKRAKGLPVEKPAAPIDPPIIPAAEIRKKTGRKPKYKPEFAEQAEALCRLGATDEELARFFKVATRTLYRWKAQYPEFCQAIKIGGAPADGRVERSLYARAVGYTFDAVKIMQHQGVPLTVKYKEHVPPDVGAMCFWLKNRMPEKWREINKTEVSVKRYEVMSDDELESIIRASSGAGGTGTAAAANGSQKPH